MLFFKVVLIKNNADKVSFFEVVVFGGQEIVRIFLVFVFLCLLYFWFFIWRQRRARFAGAEIVVFEIRNKSFFRLGVVFKDGFSKLAWGNFRIVSRGRGRVCWGRSGVEVIRQRRAVGALQFFYGYIRKFFSKYFFEIGLRNKFREVLRIR